MPAKAERSGVVCAGSWCVDYNMIINHWPAEETVATVLSHGRQGGCPGHNVATALRRLGATFPIEGIGVVGDDEDGRLLLKICEDFDIDHGGLQVRTDAATAYSLVMIDKTTGRRTFFYEAGVHALLTPDAFDFTRTTARLVHLGLPGIHEKIDAPWQKDPSGWVTILKKARAAGLRTNIELVSVEPDLIRAAAVPMLPYLDTLIVNDLEVGAVAGLETVKDGVTNLAACRQAAERILERSAISLIAVHFPGGAIVRTREGGVLEHPSVAVPQSEIVSSNGAGDSFAAGMLYGIHENWPLERTLKLAHASAASSLRSAGTTGSVVAWDKCLALAEDWGWRPAEGLSP